MNNKAYQNLGYCFATFASTDSAKYAYGNIQTQVFTSVHYTIYKIIK